MADSSKKTESVETVQNSFQNGPKDGLGSGTKGITQKKAIEMHIPYLYVLRKKGFSWKQIATLLNDKCGFKLQPATIRSYFGEMALKHVDICRRSLAEHLLSQARIEEQQRLANMPEVVRIAAAISERQRRLAEPKIVEILGLSKEAKL